MTNLRPALLCAAMTVMLLSGPARAQEQSIAAATPSLATPPESSTREWWTEDDWETVDRDVAENPPEATGKKSGWKAAGASFLLPGLGQKYAGRDTRAAVFFTTEAAIWTLFTVYRVQGEIRQDRYIEFAGVHAGAPSGENSDYYEHIGFWSSLEQWQDIVRRDARTLYPDDPTAQADYFEHNKLYDQSEAWSWPDDETRTRYRVLRSRSESAFHNSRLALGAALLNRFVSVIDAVALTRKHNQALQKDGLSLHLRFEAQDNADALVVGPVLTAEY
ncbi:MAG TPA: hypothetical protein VFR10_08180 [bacterium]|nr:hypothetical protein [bacterium]